MDKQTFGAILAWLERMEAKQDGMIVDIAAIKADLAYHIKRTDLLETAMEKKATNQRVDALEQAMKPAATYVFRLQALKWMLGGVVTAGGLYKVAQSIGLVP